MTITHIPIIRLNETPIAKAATRVRLAKIRKARGMVGSAISATIYVDGLCVAGLTNSGSGGPNDYRSFNIDGARLHGVPASLGPVVTAWAEATQNDPTYVEISDLFFEELLNYTTEMKTAEKMIAKGYDGVIALDSLPVPTGGSVAYGRTVIYGMYAKLMSPDRIAAIAKKENAAQIRVLGFRNDGTDHDASAAVSALGDSLDIGE